MTKPFAVFDIDGTVARTSLFLASVHEMMRRHMIPQTDADEIHEKLDAWLKRKHSQAFVEYEQLCIEVLFRELGNTKVSAYEAIIDEVMRKFGQRTYLYTKNLIKKLQNDGYMILAVSGSEEKLLGRFCKEYGFDDWVGTDFHKDGFYFTGSATDVVSNKHIYLQRLLDKHQLSIADSIGVGDTLSDVKMLEMVDNPICFNPSQELYEEARLRGWKIVIERKDVVYELTRPDNTFILA